MLLDIIHFRYHISDIDITIHHLSPDESVNITTTQQQQHQIPQSPVHFVSNLVCEHIVRQCLNTDRTAGSITWGVVYERPLVRHEYFECALVYDITRHCNTLIQLELKKIRAEFMNEHTHTHTRSCLGAYIVHIYGPGA